jgi:hypothetical protein
LFESSSMTEKRFAVLFAIVFAMFGAYLAFSYFVLTDRIRYRMTVEVETPAGLRTGSSVRAVSRSSPFPIAFPLLGEQRGQSWVEGEAVIVDLPEGQTLYALLTSAGGNGDFAARIPDWTMGWRTERGIAQGPVELWSNPPAASPRFDPIEERPMLVTFRDPRNPESVELVDPADLSAQFGEGVTLRRIVVEVTDEDVTEAIDARLRAMGVQPGGGLDPDPGVGLLPSSPALYQILGRRDFIQE